MVKNIHILTTMSFLMRFILLLEVVFSIVNRNWLTLFLSSLGFILTFVPGIIEKNYKITLPFEFEFILVFFIFSSLYLGEVRRYYDHFWWWDVMLHGLSGIILGIIGFIIVYIINKEKDIGVNLTPEFIAIFSLVFAVAIGAFWEITEFLIDEFFGANMQKGNADTMQDLILDSLGAIFISFVGYFYMKKVKFPLTERFVKKFVNQRR